MGRRSAPKVMTSYGSPLARLVNTLVLKSEPIKSYFTVRPVCSLKILLKAASAPAISWGAHQDGAVISVTLKREGAAFEAPALPAGAVGAVQLTNNNPALTNPA